MGVETSFDVLLLNGLVSSSLRLEFSNISNGQPLEKESFAASFFQEKQSKKKRRVALRIMHMAERCLRDAFRMLFGGGLTAF